ncbi:MAG: pyridoxamine 5'-phosphate oxidase [Bacteroidetes bacterium]|nr:pyridoxamine 5'-phosphate oxidase [Bacteroidota bacterium]
MHKSIADIRQEYLLSDLSIADLDKDPIQQFQQWFQQAVNAEIDDVNAMTLATVDADNKPHARIVLLKGVEDNQFIFFTNYRSAKGRDMEQNQQVALDFFWKELQRQIRIEGKVEKISSEASTLYFQSRPRESQLGAWASFQSETLESREVLEQRFANLKQQYENQEIPKPSHWGGYAVIPNRIEFWQGRMNRLHDRFAFTRNTSGEWELTRLNP